MANERIHKGNSIIDFPNEYTVIDIETTGLSPVYDEIIELAAIKVRNGDVIDDFTSLVKPTFEIDEYIESLTGITNDMLSTAPSIQHVLPQFMDFIGKDVLIGHNVNFDINFIYDNTVSISYKALDNDFIDTMRIFKKLHPESEHHRLYDLSNIYELDYSKAHRSLADCKITHQGYLHLYEEILSKYDNTQKFVDLFKRKSKSHPGLKAADITATTADIDEDNPLFGKVFVFTGALERMIRKDAMQIVVNHGGINGDGVTKKTNYLVLGNNDYCKSIKGGKSSKQKKAEKLKLSGQDIEIIPESVFYDMIE